MNSHKQCTKTVLPSRANATARLVAQKKSNIQNGHGNPMQQLAANSTRVQQAIQRQALAANKGGQVTASRGKSMPVQRKASQGQVAQLTGRHVIDGERTAIFKKYDILDFNGNISFMHEGVSHAGTILKEKAGSPATSLATGGLFAIDDATEELYWVTPDMVNDFWEHEAQPGDEPRPNLGDYATYERVAGPDEDTNCGGHACRQVGWKDANDIGLSDVNLYKKIEKIEGKEAPSASLPLGEYIIHAYSHFIRVVKTGADTFRTSEKNGSSATYEKTWDAAGLDGLREGGKYSTSVLYQRR